MPESYPLGALLEVREFREETAKRAVTVCQGAVREAKAAVVKAEEDLERWRVWRVAEVERRYDALIGQKTSIAKITAFNQGIAALADDELAHEMAVDKAQQNVEKAEKNLLSAKTAAHDARMNTAKIEAHKARWIDEQKIEIERAEEREFEDFKPVNRFGADGDDA